VREAPIYVGLFGTVYSEPTEREYREAVKNPYREVMIYVKSNAERDPKLSALVEAMRDDHVITHFQDVRDLVHRFGDHLREAVSRMVLRLQKLGEERPQARGSGSRLSERWAKEQRFLGEFGLAAWSPDSRNAMLAELSRSLELTR